MNEEIQKIAYNTPFQCIRQARGSATIQKSRSSHLRHTDSLSILRKCYLHSSKLSSSPPRLRLPADAWIAETMVLASNALWRSPQSFAPSGAPASFLTRRPKMTCIWSLPHGFTHVLGCEVTHLCTKYWYRVERKQSRLC